MLLFLFILFLLWGLGTDFRSLGIRFLIYSYPLHIRPYLLLPVDSGPEM